MDTSKEVFDNIRSAYNLLQDDESKWTYRNRLNYLFTGDINYIHEITRYRFPEHFEQLERVCSNAEELIIYGAGYFCIHTIEACIHYGKKTPEYLCDGNSSKWNTVGEKGIRIISPEILRKEHAHASVVVASFIYGDEIKAELSDAFDEEHLFVFGQNPERIMAEKQYFAPDIIKFEKEGEIFVDGGAYDLNTSLKLSKLTPVRKVYAFEADRQNEDKIRSNIDRYSEFPVDLYLNGLWSKEDKLSFDSGAEQESKIIANGDSGNSVIDAIPLDQVINDPVTFIKMDIEGAELNALMGAKETIKRYRPKLAICIYHKPEDMVDLPTYIRSLVPEYKFYLRAHSVLPFETVLYAVI